MLQALRVNPTQRRQREEGFTLIELLVVVIIIGILAAIAIPVFLNQRTKAWNSAVKSDLRNAASFQEAYFTEKSKYADTLGELQDEGFRNSDPVEFQNSPGFRKTNTRYCMAAHHTSNPAETYWEMDSDVGEPQKLAETDTACA